MNIITDVANELAAMFVADARLTIAILVLVALVAALIAEAQVGPAIAGGVLLLGCVVILLDGCWREARARARH